MVSTRGVRYKFSEGERVLCYEPDPTKAKVLYDSKVLEVIESKDKRGRRSVEYLIHFQGWNSSWDRCVSEDFVLKDTEENRQLQRDLAEKSQLQLGAYLYRRERKKGSSSSSTAAGSGAGKRARTGFSDDGSSSSTQPEEGETGDTDSSSGDGSASQPLSPPPMPRPGRAHINLPTQLRDRLTFDYHLVVKRGKLVQLPASPTAAEILESFVKWFAKAGAWHPQRGRHEPPHRPDLTEVSCRLNLVREVADGLRVYFDFVLRGHLLYKQELGQYHEVCGQFVNKQEEEEALKAHMGAEGKEKDNTASAETDLKSPKMPEYSHLPPDPSDTDKNGVPFEFHTEQRMLRSAPNTCYANKPLSAAAMFQERDKSSNTLLIKKLDFLGTPVGKRHDIFKVEEPVKKDASEMPAPIMKPERVSEETPSLPAPTSAPSVGQTPSTPTTPAAPKQRENRIVTRSSMLARRLRSYKSASQGDHDEPAASTSAAETRAFETLSSSLGSSGSSLSEGWPDRTGNKAPATTRTPISILLDKVTKWELITRDSTRYLPCRVYGAVHLARLFVKLPQFLNATSMPDFKLKLVLKHVELFIQYLDEHSEWFGESYYTADNVSRSH